MRRMTGYTAVPIYVSVVEGDLSREDVDILNNYDQLGQGSYGDMDLHKKLLMQAKVYLGHASFDGALKSGNVAMNIARTINRIVRSLQHTVKIVDDDFINSVDQAFTHENKSLFPLGDKERVLRFLDAHRGKECFLILGGPAPDEMEGLFEKQDSINTAKERQK